MTLAPKTRFDLRPARREDLEPGNKLLYIKHDGSFVEVLLADKPLERITHPSLYQSTWQGRGPKPLGAVRFVVVYRDPETDIWSTTPLHEVVSDVHHPDRRSQWSSPATTHFWVRT